MLSLGRWRGYSFFIFWNFSQSSLPFQQRLFKARCHHFSTCRWILCSAACHVLALDGVYARHEGVARFYKSDPISDCEVGALIEGIARKVIDHLKKKGYLDQDGTQVLNPQLDPLFGDNEAIHEATVSSIAGKIAFGPNAGKYVTRIGSGFGYEEEIPLAKGRRCYAVLPTGANRSSKNVIARDGVDWEYRECAIKGTPAMSNSGQPGDKRSLTYSC